MGLLFRWLIRCWPFLGSAPILLLGAAPAFAASLAVTSAVLVEKRVVLPDGNVRTDLVPAIAALPGDRIAVIVRYGNNGPVPLADLVIANPVPPGLVFRSAANAIGNTAAAMPELSVDGRGFGPLASLRVTLPDGSRRPARAEDVRVVRWRLSAPLPPRATGQLSFTAAIR